MPKLQFHVSYRNIYFVLNALYIFLLLVFPRAGSHFKYSELLLPVLFLMTLRYLPLIKRMVGLKSILFLALFAITTMISSALSIIFFGTDLIYLVILPVRYLEIIVPLFSIAVVCHYYPERTINFLKLLFFGLVVYLILNLFFGFQTGFYGLVVLPGETGPNQVGIVFGLFAVFFLWLYLAKMYFKDSSLHLQDVTLYALPFFLIAFLLVLLNVQRTSILALAVTFFLAIFVVLIINKRRLLIQNLKVVTAGLFVAGSILLLVQHLYGQLVRTFLYVARRFENLEGAGSYRMERWVHFFELDPWSAITTFFGLGLGSHNFFYGTGDFTLRFDSLPLRLLYETGVVGLVLFIAFHVILVVRTYRMEPTVGLLSILLSIFILVMSITFEALFVYVPASMFYVFLGVAVALSYRCSEKAKYVLAKPV